MDSSPKTKNSEVLPQNEIPYGSIPVLDHGYVRFIESSGHGESKEPESGIIEAARQSTQGSFRGWEKDERLLKYLFDNKHMTPFEFCSLTIECRAPLFVFREWHRHRTQSYNEASARYAPIPNVNYLPTVERIMLTDKKNKQAGSTKDSDEITEESAEKFIASLAKSYITSENLYQSALASGVPKEVARLSMPVGRYSQMRATANLRNWLQFLALRMSPHAQWEIRQYANAVGTIIKHQFPRVWSLFSDSISDGEPDVEKEGTHPSLKYQKGKPEKAGIYVIYTSTPGGFFEKKLAFYDTTVSRWGHVSSDLWVREDVDHWIGPLSANPSIPPKVE